MTKFGLKSRASAALATVSLALFAPMVAHADGGTGSVEASLDGVTTIADTILAFMTGPIATAAGAIAIAFVGYRWFSGRMEMGKAVATVAGIILVIGSVQIVNFIREGSGITKAQKISSLETQTVTTLAALESELIARRVYG